MANETVHKPRLRWIKPLLFLAMPLIGNGQKINNTSETFKGVLRVYEDNDFINIAGRSTDKAYTNGTKLDYYYQSRHRPGWLPAKWFPTAPGNTVQISAWGITELMFTPNDLTVTSFQQKDYPYATALYISHGMYAYNLLKKFSLQTELLGGIRGPAALGEQTQKLIHRLLKFQTPRGWSNQLQNKLLLNINLTAEKQLYNYQNTVDIIGGGRFEVGTKSTALTFYPVIRVGKMNPYFQGLIAQYVASSKKQDTRRKNIQIYLFFKPGVGFYAGNGMLQSGQQFSTEGQEAPLEPIKNTVWFVNGGAVFAISRFGISFNQNFSSALMQRLYAHGIGNLSLYYAL